MKTKRLLITTLALILCISLCSCLDLDKEKELHAKIQEDGSIVLNGQKYIELPECENFSPHITYSTGVLHLTENDVPLLLSSTLAEGNNWLSTDGVFILSESYERYTETFFCREDIYDEVIKAMESKNKEYFYCYDYSEYDHNIGDYARYYYFLTKDEAAVIDEVLANVEKTAPKATTADNSTYTYFNQFFDFTVELEERTEDLWFVAPHDYSELHLCYSTADDCYYLLIEDAETFDQSLYSISTEYNDLLDNVMTQFIGMDIEW